jgi:site-specific recombinase XerD
VELKQDLENLEKNATLTKSIHINSERTMATNAIDKGMPIEQVQKLLGHVQIDTTMQYAMVNQSNVKLAHRKFIG